MTLFNVINPYPMILNQIGGGLNDGSVYIGQPNQDPQTFPKDVFWDAAGMDPAAQPLPTIGGYITRAGTPAEVYIDGAYSIRVLDRFGAQVFYNPDATANQLENGRGNQAVNAGAVAILTGGSGYAVGDAIQLASTSVTFSAPAYAAVNAVSGGVITGITLTIPGVTASNPGPGILTFTQASTTGSGTGATFTGTMGPIASNLSLMSLSTGGGVTNGNFYLGAETPYPALGGGENTFVGDRAGAGFSGAALANTAFGHNAGGLGNGSSGLGGSGGTATGSYNSFFGNDAGRNVTGTAQANTIIGMDAARMLEGSYNTILGAGAGTPDFTTQMTGDFNVFIGYQVGAAHAITGNKNILIGLNSNCDVDNPGQSDFFGIAGENGIWFKSLNTHNAGGHSVSTAIGNLTTANGEGSFCAGAVSNAYGNYAVALGFGANTNAFSAMAIGQDVLADAVASHARGFQATTHGTLGADMFGAGKFSAQGDAQIGRYVLRGSGNSTSDIRVTADGTAAAGGNTLGIMPLQSGYALKTTVVAISVTTPSKNMCWIDWQGLLTRVSGTTALQAGTKPAPLSNGTVTGADLAMTADNTNSGLNISFTPPTGNTDTWHVVARVETVEVL